MGFHDWIEHIGNWFGFDSDGGHLLPVNGLPNADALASLVTSAGLSPHDLMALHGMGLTQAIADSQGLRPICSTETLENIFQLLIGDIHGVWNGLSDRIQEVAYAYGWGHFQDGGIVLHPEHYHDILGVLGVPCSWQPFQADLAANTLDAGRPIAAFVDAEEIGYPSPGAHAITLTGAVRDALGRVTGFSGIDSNFPACEQVWPIDRILAGMCSLAAQPGAWWAGRVLVPDVAGLWPFRS